MAMVSPETDRRLCIAERASVLAALLSLLCAGTHGAAVIHPTSEVCAGSTLKFIETQCNYILISHYTRDALKLSWKQIINKQFVHGSTAVRLTCRLLLEESLDSLV